MLVEPICAHEQPSPLDLFRVLWLRSQLPFSCSFSPRHGPLGWGSLPPFRDEKTELWVGQQASGGHSRPVGVGQGT